MSAVAIARRIAHSREVACDSSKPRTVPVKRQRGEPGHLPGATDNTRYGEGRASPRSFLTHHVANISTAIQAADAQTILNAASARMLRVSFGVM